MKDELFGSLEEITAACKDKDGNYIAIPVLDNVRYIDDVIYANVTKFCDGYGNEVETITTRLIVERLQSQVH